MKFFIILSFTVFSLCSMAFPVYAAGEEVSMPDKIVGEWGSDEECLAYHRNEIHFTMEKDGHFYLRNQGKNVIEHWFLNPRSEGDVIYLSADLKKDIHPALGIIQPVNDNLRLEYWGVREDAKKAAQFRKCTFQDMLKGIGHDPLISDDKDFEKARHISFTLGYALGATQICKGIKINDDTARYISVIALQSATKFAEAKNKLPPEKWAQDFSMQRTLGAVGVAALDKEVIPNFCEEVVKAYGNSGWVVDGLMVSVDAK